MANILQIGYTVEGATDKRFLSNIIRKTFEYVIINSDRNIEVYEPVYLQKKGSNFVEQVKNLAIDYNYFNVICIHCDSDDISPNHVINSKFIPAFNEIEHHHSACKNIVKIIPVQMTEAWLMADFDLLKKKLGTTLNNSELGLPVRTSLIESLSNPKDIINCAINKASEDMSRRRRRLSISQLYSPISQEILIEKLISLSSFNCFLNEVITSLNNINYLNT